MDMRALCWNSTRLSQWSEQELVFLSKNIAKEWNKNWGKKYSKPPTQEPSKMQTCIPSVSAVSEVAACPPSPVADDASALPSPPLLPLPVSTSSPCRPLWYLHYCTCQGTVWFRMVSLFFVCVWFPCIICVKRVYTCYSTALYIDCIR